MIRFSKYLWVYFIVSALILVPGIFSLIRYGLRQSIDFTGGAFLEIRFDRPVEQDIVDRAVDQEQLPIVNMQTSSDNTYVFRIKPEGNEKVFPFITTLAESTDQTPLVLRNETVGPILGKELLSKTVTAGVFALAVILAYVAYAFKNIKYGVSAIIALIHDLLVVLGVFSLLGVFSGVEVDTLFVTAFLTTMSFSVHDTIVVFDRIRELTHKNSRLSFEEISDMALTQTMGRSLANSFTIIFMLLALVLLGGSSVHWFSVALLVGTIAGTYSSPFVATPVLLLWDRWEKRKALRGT